jgi:hypothetical protein
VAEVLAVVAGAEVAAEAEAVASEALVVVVLVAVVVAVAGKEYVKKRLNYSRNSETCASFSPYYGLKVRRQIG